ncbi:hypothetical protein FACS1894204_02110 [Synergistales bacterium]|nr:hypothetical protein FACS1894204_02110 [Synergistales bacterium]
MDNTQSRPLDHVTARIVTEIAAAILEPLKNDIKKIIESRSPVGAALTADKTPDTPEKSPKTEMSEDLQKLLLTIDGDIKAWKGILKAEGVAQTRELSEFSSEISELVRDIKSTLLSSIDETARASLEKNAERGERLRKLTEDALNRIEKRLLRIERIELVSGVILTLLLIVAIAARV